MALPNSGIISISDIAVELGLSPDTNLSLDDSRCRNLAGKLVSASTIGLGDFHGKSALNYKLQYAFDNIIIANMGQSVWGVQGNTCITVTLDTAALANSIVEVQIHAVDGTFTSQAVYATSDTNRAFNNYRNGSTVIINRKQPETTVYKIVLKSSANVLYELNKHRNLTYGKQDSMAQMHSDPGALMAALKQRNPTRDVPANYP